MKLSVIFPCKDQSEKLLKNIEEKGLPYFDSLGISYEFLIVYDGSNEEEKRKMEEGVKKLPLQVKLVPYSPQKGKGHNVQVGFLAADGDYSLFMDADFATDLKTFELVKPYLDKGADCVVASRHSKGSLIAVKQTLKRRFISLCSRILIKLCFRFKGIHDTQCGYKVFRTSIAKEIAKRQIIMGFAFDVEYLYFLKLNGFSYYEVPCVWDDDAESTINKAAQTSLSFMKDMRRIKKNKKNYKLTEEEKKGLKNVHR